MDSDKELKKFNLSGDKGDSLFTEPMKGLITDSETQEIREKLNKRIEQYYSAKDDRALALVGAMILESELDELLSAWLPNYRYISYDKEFTFSAKINLAISAQLIPGKILNAMDPIKRIRNIFAYKLEIDTFQKAREIDSEAPEKRRAFVMLYNKVKTFLPQWDLQDDRITFRDLILVLAASLSIYTKHLVKLNKKLRDPEYLNKIMQE